MEKVNAQGETLEEFLAHYDDSQYKHPSNTVDMILMSVHDDRLKLLLVRRGNHPFIGSWALPGGFVEFDEDLDQAVLRELSEETHITEAAYFRQLYTLGNADRDPRTRIITTGYLSLTPWENVRQAAAGDDAADTAWFNLTKTTEKIDTEGRTSILSLVCPERDLHMEFEITDEARHNYIATTSKKLDTSNCELAADHIKLINKAIDQLQHRSGSTGILFNLLPPEFTLRQAQTAYEAIIGKKTDTGNFRRDIRKMLTDTGKQTRCSGRRAELYRFNPMFAYLKENL
jgi:ADP-ribose pyrophosphatase YjhB (NUDIX family)